MARKRLPTGEKKEALIIYIEGKYLENQDKEALKEIAYEAIVKHVTK